MSVNMKVTVPRGNSAMPLSPVRSELEARWNLSYTILAAAM
jgi:hypothetical protein